MPYWGVVLNLCVLSAPLLLMVERLIEIPFLAFISSPVVLLFYSLISIFCFLESKVSVCCNDSLTESSEKPLLPYFASISVLVVFWASIYSCSQSSQDYSVFQISLASIVMLIGILIRTLSIKTLQAFFVSHVGLVNDHQLVKSGLYSVVRHPSELGLILICLGIPLLTSSLYALCATLTLILPSSLYRVLLEDKMINTAFGKDFINYKSSVPALIPNLLLRKKAC